jgi:hypothetical protein
LEGVLLGIGTEQPLWASPIIEEGRVQVYKLGPNIELVSLYQS